MLRSGGETPCCVNERNASHRLTMLQMAILHKVTKYFYSSIQIFFRTLVFTVDSSDPVPVVEDLWVLGPVVGDAGVPQLGGHVRHGGVVVHGVGRLVLPGPVLLLLVRVLLDVRHRVDLPVVEGLEVAPTGLHLQSRHLLGVLLVVGMLLLLLMVVGVWLGVWLGVVVDPGGQRVVGVVGVWRRLVGGPVLLRHVGGQRVEAVPLLGVRQLRQLGVRQLARAAAQVAGAGRGLGEVNEPGVPGVGARGLGEGGEAHVGAAPVRVLLLLLRRLLVPGRAGGGLHRHHRAAVGHLRPVGDDGAVVLRLLAAGRCHAPLQAEALPALARRPRALPRLVLPGLQVHVVQAGEKYF